MESKCQPSMICCDSVSEVSWKTFNLSPCNRPVHDSIDLFFIGFSWSWSDCRFPPSLIGSFGTSNRKVRSDLLGRGILRDCVFEEIE